MKWLIPKFSYPNMGLLFLRLALGASFIYHHGYAKISDPGRWMALGENMSLINIEFAPAFWGFMAAFAEFFGSVFIILGLFFRPSTILLIITMMIAVLKNHAVGDGFDYSLNMLIVFLFLFITGPGKYSLDERIR